LAGVKDILYIRELIAEHPGESRRTLSKKLREAWPVTNLWVFAAGR